MTDEKMYTFWLCNKQGIGIKKITDLLCFFKEAEYIFKASKEELMQVRSLKEKDIDLLLSGQDEDYFDPMLCQLFSKSLCQSSPFVRHSSRTDNRYTYFSFFGKCPL